MIEVFVCGHCGAEVEEDACCGCYRDVLADLSFVFLDPAELAWTPEFVALVQSDVYGG